MNPDVAAARVLVGSLAPQEFLAMDWGEPTSARWEELLQAAHREGLGGILAEELSRSPSWRKLAAPFQRGQFLRAVAYQKLLLELAEICRSLSTEGMLLKGMALVQSAYGGRIGLRPLGDVDLVLPEAWVLPFERVLIERGFHRLEPGTSSFGRGDDLVDLHADLLNARRVPSRSRAYHLRAASFLARSSPLDGDLGGLLLPHPVDHLLFLCVHALKHSHSRLFWLVDIALLASQCEPAEVLDQARETGTERPLAYAYSLLEAVLGFTAPEKPALRYSWMETMYLRWVARRRNVHGTGELLTCLSLPTWGAVATYLGELLWPGEREPRTTAQRARRVARYILEFTLKVRG